MDHRAQVTDAIHDRGVHHVPAARPACAVEGSKYTDRQVHRAPAEVSEQVQRHHGAAIGRADRTQQPSQGYVVDVVPRGGRQGPALPPPGHPPVDQCRVGLMARSGTNPKPLRDPRAPALDEDVRPACECDHRLYAGGGLQIHLHRPAAGGQRICLGETGEGSQRRRHAPRPVHPHHIRP